MSLMETLNNDLKNAMKAKEEAKLSTLRLLKAALKNKQIDLQPARPDDSGRSGGHELTDEEILAVVKSQIKQLKDSVDSFASAGRDDLVQPAKQEITLLETYLPAQMDEAALEAIVKEAVTNAGATSKADMGRAMGAAMKAVAGRADGTRVKQIVETLLSVFALAAVLVFGSAPTVQAAASAAPSFEAFVEPTLRMARVFLMLFGLVSVNYILISGFKYMVASGRDDEHHHAEAKFFSGLLSTIVIAGLFAVVTVALQKL